VAAWFLPCCTIAIRRLARATEGAAPKSPQNFSGLNISPRKANDDTTTPPITKRSRSSANNWDEHLRFGQPLGLHAWVADKTRDQKFDCALDQLCSNRRSMYATWHRPLCRVRCKNSLPNPTLIPRERTTSCTSRRSCLLDAFVTRAGIHLSKLVDFLQG
jgi:hypothetical protein